MATRSKKFNPPSVGEEVTYVQARHVPPLHESRVEHKAVVTFINEDGSINLSVKNSEGVPTVPVSRVAHKSVADEGMSHYVV